jgi:transposase-like protein
MDRKLSLCSKQKDIMGARRIFTREYKERAVELALKTNRKQTEIAQELGITGNMLARWKREMKESERGSMKAFSGRGNARDEQMARLRKKNADLWETNEILKKAFVHLHGTKSPLAAYLSYTCIKDSTRLRRWLGNWGQPKWVVCVACKKT